MIKRNKLAPKTDPKYTGPFIIFEVTHNGNLKLAYRDGTSFGAALPPDQLKLVAGNWWQEAQNDEVFDVEAILDHRLLPDESQYEYLIKWEGYPPSANSWVKEEHCYCTDLVKAYWRQLTINAGDKAAPVRKKFKTRKLTQYEKVIARALIDAGMDGVRSASRSALENAPHLAAAIDDVSRMEEAVPSDDEPAVPLPTAASVPLPVAPVPAPRRRTSRTSLKAGIIDTDLPKKRVSFDLPVSSTKRRRTAKDYFVTDNSTVVNPVVHPADASASSAAATSVLPGTIPEMTNAVAILHEQSPSVAAKDASPDQPAPTLAPMHSDFDPLELSNLLSPVPMAT